MTSKSSLPSFPEDIWAVYKIVAGPKEKHLDILYKLIIYIYDWCSILAREDKQLINISLYPSLERVNWSTHLPTPFPTGRLRWYSHFFPVNLWTTILSRHHLNDFRCVSQKQHVYPMNRFLGIETTTEYVLRTHPIPCFLMFFQVTIPTIIQKMISSNRVAGWLPSDLDKITHCAGETPSETPFGLANAHGSLTVSCKIGCSSMSI